MSKLQRRVSPSVVVPKTALDRMQLVLQDLPERSKETLSIKEAMEQLQEDLTATLAKGYSLDDLAAILSDNDIQITVPSLKYYLARFKKAAAASSKKGKSPGKAQRPVASRRKPSGVKTSGTLDALADIAPASNQESSPNSSVDTTPTTAPKTSRRPAKTGTSKATEKPPAKPGARSTIKTRTAPKSTSTSRRKKENG